MRKKIFYKRRLPHWHPPMSDFFITYRLAGSIPENILAELRKNYHSHDSTNIIALKERRKLHFKSYEKFLEQNNNGPHWLKIQEIATNVFESLLFRNDTHYKLWCATLMSNHVHVVLRTLKEGPTLTQILQNHKKFTANQNNKILGRTGKFWAEESYDTVIRNKDQFGRAIKYTLQNPVTAGLVKSWKEWKWTYLHPDLDQIMGDR